LIAPGVALERLNPATVQPITNDRYGRTVARVRCHGVDASERQLRAGMAWVFDRYVADRWLYWTQEDARTARRGLWSDAQPVAPWQWRRSAH
jgi:endonuclease YncB( thermonuclease family)